MSLCTVCGAEAIITLSLPDGCQALDDTAQDLCPQHALTVTPAGTVEVVAVHRRDVAREIGWLP